MGTQPGFRVLGLVIYSYGRVGGFARPFDWFYDCFLLGFTEFSTRFTEISTRFTEFGTQN